MIFSTKFYCINCSINTYATENYKNMKTTQIYFVSGFNFEKNIALFAFNHIIFII